MITLCGTGISPPGGGGSGIPGDAYLTPDGSDYFKTPDGSDYYATP